jgi:hypothetical protein
MPDALTPDPFEDQEDDEDSLAQDLQMLARIASNPAVSPSIRRLARRVLGEITPPSSPAPEDLAMRQARLERRARLRSNRPRLSRRPAPRPPAPLGPAHRDDEDAGPRSLRSPRRG